MRVLVTGGAGFIGANVAIGLAGSHPDWTIVAADNLKRRGAELNLPRLRTAGVTFSHADVRVREDLVDLGSVDALVECSAEPSALAGVGGSPDYVVMSNLVGAYNCLELARRHGAYLLFLSSSRWTACRPRGSRNDFRWPGHGRSMARPSSPPSF